MKKRTRPYHEDGCQHGPDCYVGSFEYMKGPRDEVEKCDVYVWEDVAWGQELCIRHGSEASEYYSPGRTVDFMLHASDPFYRKALEVLLEHGKIVWVKKEQPMTTYTIPMFLGYKTETDSKELADYLAALCDKDESQEARAHRLKLSTEFDDKFPGLRTATVRALRSVETGATCCQLLEFIDGKVRATSAHGRSPWIPTEANTDGKTVEEEAADETDCGEDNV